MFDIAIIGAGPGGYVAALRAGQNGARVALIEKNELGGVCLNRGCIPTKAFIASAHAAFAVKKASEFGVRTTGKIEIDMQAVLARKNAIVETLRGGIEKLLKSCNVKLLKGDARFVSENEVEAGGEKIKAKNFIIATGSSWVELPALKIDGKNIVTSDEVLDFSRLPKSIAIVGGGVVGCEFACMLNTFGVQVTIIEAMPSILPMMEKGITRFLARSMKSDGIKILTETRVESAVVEEGRVFCRLSNGESMETSKLMVAAGRRPVFFDLGLDAAGVVLSERGFIKTDAYLRTSCPHIFAIGDCRGGRMLAHEASAEGVAAVDNILNGSSVEIETDFIPSPVFTFPEIGSVGFTSDELKEKGIVFKTGRFPYAACGKALCDGESEGQVMVHADPQSGRIYGVHVFGKDATLIIAEAVLAIKNALNVAAIERTIHSHPTLSEALAEAAADVLGMAIHKQRAQGVKS